MPMSRAYPGFQVRGAHLKKLPRAEGGSKIFGVSRMKNHDFTPKNHIFFNFRGGSAPGAPPLQFPRKLFGGTFGFIYVNYLTIIVYLLLSFSFLLFNNEYMETQ